MNVEELNEQLRDNYELISKVLVTLGFNEEKLKYHASNNIITCTRPDPDADNPNGYMIYCHSLWWRYNTRQGSGNIYTLVMDMKNVNFPHALKLVAKWIGYSFKDVEDVNVRLPFGGFYKEFICNQETRDTDLKIYDKKLLPDPACNIRFRKDGISYITQEVFDLRFDFENNAIIIPIYNSNHDLVGSKARKNEDIVSNKYWTPLSFSKTNVVFGLAQNYKSIVQKRQVIIFEAEKSVMQCYDFRCFVAVAIMGHDISLAQARLIKSLMCQEIIIAFDEGVSEEDIKKSAAMVYSNNSFYKNKVSYIYGGLPAGSKMSPSDLGKERFRQLLLTQKKTFKGV